MGSVDTSGALGFALAAAVLPAVADEADDGVARCVGTADARAVLAVVTAADTDGRVDADSCGDGEAAAVLEAVAAAVPELDTAAVVLGLASGVVDTVACAVLLATAVDEGRVDTLVLGAAVASGVAVTAEDGDVAGDAELMLEALGVTVAPAVNEVVGVAAWLVLGVTLGVLACDTLGAAELVALLAGLGDGVGEADKILKHAAVREVVQSVGNTPALGNMA